MFLQGRRALVTGSTSGIGLAIARALAAEGAKVVLNGFGAPEDIDQLCGELGATFAAGDLCSTAGDLLRWQRALWSGRVLTQSSLSSMTRAEIQVDGSSSYGLGLRLGKHQGHTAYFHGGRVYGYTSQLCRYPDDDLTIAVLTNTETKLARDLQLAIAGSLLGLDAIGLELPLD